MFVYPQMPMEAAHMDASMMSDPQLATGYMVCGVSPSMPIGMLMPVGPHQDAGLMGDPHSAVLSSPSHNRTDVPAGGSPHGTGTHSRGRALARKDKVAAVAAHQKGAGKNESFKAFLSPLSSEEGRLAARALAMRVLAAKQLKANHSIFSALNVDVVRSPHAGLAHGRGSAVSLEGEARRTPDSWAEPVVMQCVKRQHSVQSQDTAAPDSDGKESESCRSSTASEQWDEVAQTEGAEARAAGKPNFGEVRRLLLGFRLLTVGPAPPELEDLKTVAMERKAPAPQPPASTGRLAPASPTASPAARIPDSPSAAALVGSQPRAQHSRSQLEDLRRTVKSHLNKVCPENVVTISERISAIEVADLEQLETIIELIFKKALSEPHYCETYADLVFSLKSVFPEFPSPDSGKPITFKSLVLNICQNEFEELLTIIKPSTDDEVPCDDEELECRRATVAGRMRANMKFIGHLFLRRLLSAKVIGSVLCELVLCEFEDHLPEENAIECACELLLSVGHTLETMPTGAGAQAVQQVCSRLLDLKVRKTPQGKAAYRKRIQFMIQDVIDTKAANWVRKLFNSSAKTLEEIRLEPAKPEELVVAGQRPQYLEPAKALA